MRPRLLALPALATLLALIPPGTLGAQLAPLTVPRGWLRVDLSSAFTSWDRRYFNGVLEDAGADFTQSTVGRSVLPALQTADSLLALVTGQSDAALNLGSSSASQLVVTGAGGIGLAWGLTRWLTLYGNVPFVRVRVRSTFDLDSTTSNAGTNPAHAAFGTGDGQLQTQEFFGEFDAALLLLADRLATGYYDADPPRKALAEDILAQGNLLRDRLFVLFSAAFFLPTDASATGLQLLTIVTGLQATLRDDLDVVGFTQIPALPAQRASSDAFREVLSSPSGPVRGVFDTPIIVALGDIELGAAIGFLDTYDPDRRVGFRLAGQGLVRLRTSRREDPLRLFDVGTGERQPDVETMGVADLFLNRVGFRAMGGYTLQLAGTAERHIVPQDVPFPSTHQLALVRQDPGDILTLGVQPYLRLASNFAVTGGAVWRRKGADDYSYAAGQVPVSELSPNVLAEDSEMTWTTATAGLIYSAPLTVRGSRRSRPVDAGVLWEGVVSATEGRVPKSSAFRFYLRLYLGR